MWCVGEGIVIPVKIVRDAEVSALQEAIAGIMSSIPSRLVTLYLAKKGGAWLKDHKRPTPKDIETHILVKFNNKLDLSGSNSDTSVLARKLQSDKFGCYGTKICRFVRP
ncbi:CRN-like protein [Plasmopara halstedii]|uniref:CRN-like protein n=1 Tax=Plasmopara halstedii TaxID=4781 RepID=A0A0P1AJC4_PLAHL|nr:CRN-like protein [Plasmopara halstedii]CEG41152.1 CRN-like protein [Plasmopara halstedii]|eukprot:XP_024577521.1 CRN-like protein [Plasmopara halstedii]